MKKSNQISILSRKSLQLAVALLVVLGSVLLVPGSTARPLRRRTFQSTRWRLPTNMSCIV